MNHAELPLAARRRRELPVLVALFAALAAGGTFVVRTRGAPDDPAAGPARPRAAAFREPEPRAPRDTPVRTAREFVDLRAAATPPDALLEIASHPAWTAGLFDGRPAVPLGQVVVVRDDAICLVRWERLGDALRWKVALPFGGEGTPLRVMVLRSIADWVPSEGPHAGSAPGGGSIERARDLAARSPYAAGAAGALRALETCAASGEDVRALSAALVAAGAADAGPRTGPHGEDADRRPR